MSEFEVFRFIPPQWIGTIALLLVVWWQQKTIQKFIDSQPEIAKSLSELSTLVEILVKNGGKGGIGK